MTSRSPATIVAELNAARERVAELERELSVSSGPSRRVRRRLFPASTAEAAGGVFSNFDNPVGPPSTVASASEGSSEGAPVEIIDRASAEEGEEASPTDFTDELLGTIFHLTPDILDSLIARGFDVNGYVTYDNVKMSPLGLACALKAYRAVESLLTAGADIERGTIPDSGVAQTPYHMVIAWRNTQPCVGTPEYEAYMRRMSACARHLAVFGAVLDLPNSLYEVFRSDIDTLFN